MFLFPIYILIETLMNLVMAEFDGTMTIIPFHFTSHNFNLKKIGSLDEENFKKSNEVIPTIFYFIIRRTAGV